MDPTYIRLNLEFKFWITVWIKNNWDFYMYLLLHALVMTCTLVQLLTCARFYVIKEHSDIDNLKI